MKAADTRSLYLVIIHGSLVAFSSDGRVGMQPRRAVWPLFGSFVYSGMLASDELDSNPNETAWDPHHRVYQDGLQSSDSVEDTTFCIRLVWPTGPFAAPQPWDVEENRRDTNQDGSADSIDSNSAKDGNRPKFVPPPLRREPQRLLICRARSKVSPSRPISTPREEAEETEEQKNHGNRRLTASSSATGGCGRLIARRSGLRGRT